MSNENPEITCEQIREWIAICRDNGISEASVEWGMRSSWGRLCDALDSNLAAQELREVLAVELGTLCRYLLLAAHSLESEIFQSNCDMVANHINSSVNSNMEQHYTTIEILDHLIIAMKMRRSRMRRTAPLGAWELINPLIRIWGLPSIREIIESGLNREEETI